MPRAGGAPHQRVRLLHRQLPGRWWGAVCMQAKLDAEGVPRLSGMLAHMQNLTRPPQTCSGPPRRLGPSCTWLSKSTLSWPRWVAVGDWQLLRDGWLWTPAWNMVLRGVLMLLRCIRSSMRAHLFTCFTNSLCWCCAGRGASRQGGGGDAGGGGPHSCPSLCAGGYGTGGGVLVGFWAGLFSVLALGSFAWPRI